MARQHYIKKGIVDDYSNSSSSPQKGIIGFHLERWLKRALKALNVQTFDDCCDSTSVNPPSPSPVRYDSLSGNVQAFVGGTWANVDDTTQTASRALVTNSSGKMVTATTTSTEIGYVNGVTSAIQTQLNNKVTLVAAPSTATSTGVAGSVAYDSGFIYICIATNSWKRVAVAAW